MEQNAQKTSETNPGTLPGTRWNEEFMMERNATRVGRQTPEPGTGRNQEMMMEQNARRIGRQAREPYPEPNGTSKPRNTTRHQKEPENTDGTKYQKIGETSPGTLPRNREKPEKKL